MQEEAGNGDEILIWPPLILFLILLNSTYLHCLAIKAMCISIFITRSLFLSGNSTQFSGQA
jgi:hypothetical protein